VKREASNVRGDRALEQLKDLPEETRRTLKAFVDEAPGLFGTFLESVILYGSAARGEFLPGRSNLNLLVLMKELTLDLLRCYARVHRRWARENVVVPLFLTGKEIRTWHGSFPVEFQDIQAHHVVLVGPDPFVDLQVDPRAGSLPAMQGIRGNVLRFRQRVVEGGATPEALGVLLPLSVTSLVPHLRSLLQTRAGLVPRSTDEVLQVCEDTWGTDLQEWSAVKEAWRLKRGMISPGPLEIPRLCERYLLALQSLAEHIHNPRAEGGR